MGVITAIVVILALAVIVGFILMGKESVEVIKDITFKE